MQHYVIMREVIMIIILYKYYYCEIDFVKTFSESYIDKIFDKIFKLFFSIIEALIDASIINQ